MFFQADESSSLVIAHTEVTPDLWLSHQPSLGFSSCPHPFMNKGTRTTYNRVRVVHSSPSWRWISSFHFCCTQPVLQPRFKESAQSSMFKDESIFSTLSHTATFPASYILSHESFNLNVYLQPHHGWSSTLKSLVSSKHFVTIRFSHLCPSILNMEQILAQPGNPSPFWRLVTYAHFSLSFN